MRKATMKKSCIALAILAFGLGADAAPYEYTFNTDGAPELKGWTETNLVPVVREWYPKLVEMFPSEGWTPYTNVTFRYKAGIGCPAYASGGDVTLDPQWIKANPGDVGCAVHEIFHVVQSGYRRTPGWITEGVADYVRWYLYEPGAHGCDMDVLSSNVRYSGAYRVSANFLNFVETRFPGTVRDLNALCRRGRYDEAVFWPKRTGKTVLELEDEWKGRLAAAKAPAMRVMTYNIRCAGGDRKSKDNNWNARRVDLAHVIERENPDVAGFQEVEPGQLNWLRARLAGYAFVGVGRNAGGDGEASPIAYRESRFEAVANGTFWLSETPDVPGSKGWDAALPRVCTYVVLKDKATGRTFSFANTHTDHRGAEAREKGLLLVVERMKEFGRGAPIIFTGDHNCLEHEAPAKAVAKVMKDALYLSETPPEGPWRTFNFWSWHEKELSISEAMKKPVGARSIDGHKSDAKRIDYIYVSPGTKVLSYRTIADPRPGTKLYASDHFPCSATLVLE